MINQGGGEEGRCNDIPLNLIGIFVTLDRLQVGMIPQDLIKILICVAGN